MKYHSFPLVFNCNFIIVIKCFILLQVLQFSNSREINISQLKYNNNESISSAPIARIIVRHNSLNTEKNSTEEIVISDFPNSFSILDKNTTENGTVYLQCLAKYPVEWIYEGDGYPDTLSFAETRRTFRNFSDPSTYEFVAEINLVRVQESNTGNYTCREIRNNKNAVFFYIFVPGEAMFLEHINPNVRAETVNQNGKKDSSKVTLPCRVTDPSTQVYLGKYETKTGLKQFYPDNSSLVYNPSQGFTIDVEKYEDPWGLYICNANRNNRAFRTLLLPPKGQEFRVTPAKRLVPLQKDAPETFKCEAREKIYLDIPGSYIPTIKYERNDSWPFPFVASIEISKPENFENHSVITCGTLFGNRELHRWEYTTYGEKNLRFSYDPTLKSFLCCTDSFYKPEMYLVPMCSSIMECQIQKHCTKTRKYPCMEKADERDIAGEVPFGCSAFSTGYHHREGMFVCSVGEPDPDDQDRIQKEFYFFYHNETPVINFSLDNISSEEILKLSIVNNNGTIYANEEVEVFCTPNHFFFSKGEVWAFQRKNGTVEFVTKDIIKKTLVRNVGQLPPTKINTIIFPDSDITALICYAPVWNSATEWRNVSVPVNVIDE